MGFVDTGLDNSHPIVGDQMIPYCVFDIEVAKTLTEVAKELNLKNEKDAFAYPHKMGFGVGVVYDSISDQFFIFNSAKEMAQFLLHFEGILISFNGKRFDFAVLLDGIDIDTYNVLQGLPHLDILQDFFRGVGGKFRVGLDNIAKNTIGRAKTGNGADAPILFQQGKMDELIAYCKNDVILTRDVFLFGWGHKYIMYWDAQKSIGQVMPVDWSQAWDDGGPL